MTPHFTLTLSDPKHPSPVSATLSFNKEKSMAMALPEELDIFIEELEKLKKVFEKKINIHKKHIKNGTLELPIGLTVPK